MAALQREIKKRPSQVFAAKGARMVTDGD